LRLCTKNSTSTQFNVQAIAGSMFFQADVVVRHTQFEINGQTGDITKVD